MATIIKHVRTEVDPDTGQETAWIEIQVSDGSRHLRLPLAPSLFRGDAVAEWTNLRDGKPMANSYFHRLVIVIRD